MLHPSIYVDDLPGRLAIINLTHEAKGLDTYQKTRQKLQRAGDMLSIDILDANFKEEVGHVAAGVRWFTFICFLEQRQTTAAAAAGSRAVSTLCFRRVYCVSAPIRWTRDNSRVGKMGSGFIGT